MLQLMVAIPGTVPTRHLSHALVYAANKGLSDCVEILLEHGKVDPDSCNSSNTTCVMHAAQNGHDKVVQLLISAGCCVNARNSSGSTALQYAAQYGHITCVELLLSAGAIVNTQDREKNTPLMAAARNCLFAPCVLECLLQEKNCRLNVQNVVGKTALHFVVRQADLISWSGALLAAGSDPDIRDEEGNTPFMLASTEGFDEVMKCLLAFHCNPDIRNNYGKSPIHFLAQKNHHHIINMMGHLHCDFDPVDASGNVPLHYAVKHNRPEAVKALLLGNCKLESWIPPATNPLELALSKKLWGIAKLLVLAGIGVGPLYTWLEQVEQEARSRHRERLTLFEEQREEEEVDMDLEESIKWFTDWLHKPHSLQQLCRIIIRQKMGRGILRKSSDLPVPPAMQDCITLKEVYEHHVKGFLM